MTCRWRRFILLLLVIVSGTGIIHPAHAADSQPFIWRKLVSGSSTIEEAFSTRTPQFILFRDGLIIYRDGAFKKPYQQVRLNKQELSAFYIHMQNTYGLPGLTPGRLKRELPYIKSVQKAVYNDNTRVSIWIGMHTPPSLHTFGMKLLQARSVNERLGPGWKGLYELSQLLSVYIHTKAETYLPDRVEIAVQILPSYLTDQADQAVAWSLTDVDLNEAKGKRMRGFKTLKGEAARQAYTFLTEHQIVKSDDTVFLVWVRPLILP